MVNCYMYDFPGRSITLGCPSNADTLKRVTTILDAIDDLGDIIVPLCAGMSLGSYSKRTGLKDWKTQPYQPFYQIYESSVPEGIVVKLLSDKSLSTSTTNLSKNTLYLWIKEALEQPYPYSNTHEIDVYELVFYAVRAKVHDYSQLKNKKFMIVEHDRRGSFRFPLGHRNDGLWVYSPIKDLKTEPSFTITSGESAGITINIHWTWWTLESLVDRDALEAAILRIIARGWTIEYLHESLNFPKLKSIFEASGKLPR